MRPHASWYRKDRNAWYVEIKGERHRLGNHPEDEPPPKKGKGGWSPPKEIMTAFHKLMAADPSHIPKDVKVCQVCDLFLDFSQKHHAPEWFRQTGLPWAADNGAFAGFNPPHSSRCWIRYKTCRNACLSSAPMLSGMLKRRSRCSDSGGTK